MEQKAKKISVKAILLIAAVLVIISLLVFSAVTDASGKTVDCPDCTEGYNACSVCAGSGIVNENESLKPCEECEGEGKFACETCAEEGVMRGTLWALLPALIAISLALITKEVYSSLFIGILSGGLLYARFAIAESFSVIMNDGLISAVSGTAGIFIFLVELGVIVALINKAGGSAAFGKWAQEHVKSRVGVMLATFVLGIMIFVDDYFNCLTVGSVMRPATDEKKVSRAKLSYIIDATAAPICMIAPISSWAAAVSGYIDGEDDIGLFIKTIPYNFYSILTIVFVMTIILTRVDYGPMKLHEMNAMLNGDLYTAGERVESKIELDNRNGRVYDLVIPVVTLIVACIFGLLYVGDIFGENNLIKAFSSTDATVGLPLGGLIALIIIIAYLACRRIVTFKESMEAIPQGFIAMVPAILILTLATALKNMTSILGAKYYVHSVMEGSAGALGSLLPAIIFLVACVLAFATGTSWGTFGILIPIVIPIFSGDPELLIIGMSACLAGAVCGDHCSPISDTTIMSSAGAECNHINHVSTQMPYAITVAAISFVMFVISGFVQNIWICMPLGIILTVAVVFGIKYVDKYVDNKKNSTEE